jgi:hypothetical protein
MMSYDLEVEVRHLKNEVVELSDAVRFLIRLLMYIKDINPNTYDRDYADWVDDTDWS